MLERQKVEDSQEYYISWLKNEKAEGRVDRHTHYYNCGKEGHISRECRGERRNQERRGNGGQMADMAKSMAAMQEILKKLVPEAVFP